MTCLLLSQHGPDPFILAQASSSRGLLAAALSNQFYAAYLPDLDHSAQNQSPSPRMGWTNEQASHSSMRLFPATGTNDTGFLP